MHRLARFVSIALLLAGAGAGLTACDLHTGRLRCDKLVAPYITMRQNGYTLDCTPGFEPVGDHGQAINGWTDAEHHKVYLWPSQLAGDALPKTAWHEAGHTKFNHDQKTVTWWRKVRGIATTDVHALKEDFAETYSWCSHRYRVGYRFQGSVPTAAACQAATA